MRRTIPVLAVFLLVLAFVALPASATPPVHERYLYEGVFDPGNPDPDLSFGVPEICDFDYVQSWTFIMNVTTWGDPDDFDRQIINGPYVARHTNATSGSTLVEKGSYTVILEDNGVIDRESGLFWHLRDPDTGKLVVVKAGRMVWDYDTGTVIFTPNTDQDDFWGLICTALGGDVN